MNPFKVLNIQRDASKKEIINGMVRALRDRKYSAKEIAEAQRELLNPISRTAHTIINFINVESFFSQTEIEIVKVGEDEQIKPLSIFDET